MAEPPLVALLGKAAKYSGDLTFEGRVRVDGRFTGRIFTHDTLEIGASGEVDGEIEANVLIVAGVARGKVRVLERLVLLAGGALFGQVEAEALEAHPGGRVDATVRVG